MTEPATVDVNLTAVAATICTELRNEKKAGAALLHHAMAAGDALNLAQANLHKTNLTWKGWLRREHPAALPLTCQRYPRFLRWNGTAPF